MNSNSSSNCAVLSSLRRQISQKKQFIDAFNRLSVADADISVSPTNYSMKSLNRLNSYDLTFKHSTATSSRHSLKHQYHSHCYYHHYHHNHNHNHHHHSNYLAMGVTIGRTFSDSILNKLKYNRKQPDLVEIV